MAVDELLLADCATHGRQPAATAGAGRRNEPCCASCIADMQATMLARVLDGKTLRSISRTFGYSAERVRQIVSALEPAAVRIGAAIRHERRVLAAEVAEQKRLASIPPCRTCLGPIPQQAARRRYCCTDCAGLWDLVGRWLDRELRERHRIWVARCNQHHPDPAKSASARRVLDGTARRHRFAAPNGEVTRAALREVARLRGVSVEDLLRLGAPPSQHAGAGAGAGGGS